MMKGQNELKGDKNWHRETISSYKIFEGWTRSIPNTRERTTTMQLNFSCAKSSTWWMWFFKSSTSTSLSVENSLTTAQESLSIVSMLIPSLTPWMMSSPRSQNASSTDMGLEETSLWESTKIFHQNFKVLVLESRCSVPASLEHCEWEDIPGDVDVDDHVVGGQRPGGVLQVDLHHLPTIQDLHAEPDI